MIAHLLWQRRNLEEIRRAYDEELRTGRIEAYGKLWKEFQPLAVYAPDGDVTYAELGALGKALRRWYFEDGGLLLTESARQVYFVVQDAVARAASARGRATVLRRADKLWTQEELADQRKRLRLVTLAGTRRGREDVAAWEADVRAVLARWPFRADADDDFVLLQFLASSLRTQLARGIHTRAASVLGEP